MHRVPKYLLKPTHPVTISLIGCGGTGSQMLSGLARIDRALQAMEHPGLHVITYDPDFVSDSNIGRQLFAPVEIGMNKAVALTARINRFYGLTWEAVAEGYNGAKTNLIISCVDTVASRIEIASDITEMSGDARTDPYRKPYYWMDFGNGKNFGQVVLGGITPIPQDEAEEEYCDNSILPTVMELYPDMADDEDPGPSCSLAIALSRQDLFINTTLAAFGLTMLWRMFREGQIEYSGLYLNLETMRSMPISI